jgi:hypothetical protein
MINDRSHALVRSISARARSTRSVIVDAASIPTYTSTGVARAGSRITVWIERSGTPGMRFGIGSGRAAATA